MLEQSLRQKILQVLTRPLAHYCMRHSHALQDVIAALKVNLVELASKETSLASGRLNVSRISVLTGVHRADVNVILRQGQTPGIDRSSLIQRVIGQWRHDSDFCSAPNKPRVLSFEGAGNEFHKLVETLTTAVHPTAVLRELDRLGFVEKTRKGLKLRLQFESVSDNPEQGFSLVAKDMDTLLRAAEENVLKKVKSSNLHIRTEYDNIAVKHLPKIKIWIREEGKAFHKRVREYLAQYDKDLTDGLEKEVGGGLVSVGAFALVEEGRTEDNHSVSDAKKRSVS